MSGQVLDDHQLEIMRTMESGLGHVKRSDEVTLSGDGATAWREFEAAARELRDASEKQQAAAARYQEALKNLSRVAAPPSK